MTNLDPAFQSAMQQMLEDRETELHPDLVSWVEEGDWGPMLRHPLVYQVPLISPGLANKAYEQKQKALVDAIMAEEWGTVIWIHERPHRLNALIEYCTGTFDIPEEGEDEPRPVPLVEVPASWELAADVWVDSENIQQEIVKWRHLITPTDVLLKHGAPNLWLGTDEERESFQKLPDPILAYRGGTVGDWSWTTDWSIASFFSRRSGLPVRSAWIPKSDCFGYLTRRGESELLVRLTPERYPLVYPEGEPS